ncbi:MAG: aldehyde dehydrogenase family protein [Candidatus Omnitrophota bacterium]
MKKFTLLVGGKELDTGNYGYFPYADKYISNFKNTFRVLTEIKTGKLQEDSDEAKEYVFAKYCLVDDDTNRLAIDSAYRAFQEFRKVSLATRKKLLLDCYDLLIQKKEEFIKLMIIEGHPRKLAEWEFEGMRMGTCPETIDFYCKQVRLEIGRNNGEILYWSRKPDGVVCMTTPANASASDSYNGILVLITGNTIVVRPSLGAPLSTLFLWKDVVYEAIVKNKCPLGTVNIVVGNPKKVMDEWVESPHVNDIIFFGDSKRGLEIGARIFQAGKKPILELSGNDIVLVWKDGNLDKASDSLLDCFLGSTQICMVPKIALVHHEAYNEFSRLMIKKTKLLKASLPSDPETISAPVGKIKDYFDFLKDAEAKGARVLYGGERLNYLNRADSEGMFLRPTLLEVFDISNSIDMRCVKEEIFFPLLPLIIVPGADEEAFEKMIRFVNEHNYGIRTSLWISSAKYMRKFAKQLDNCGMLRINSRHIAFSPYLSTHGGTCKSGGPFGEMNYFWLKTSHLQGVSRILDK